MKYILIILLICFSTSCGNDVIDSNIILGTVIKISDGDTFVLLNKKKQIKIRLYGIDCPEKKQPFGQRAKQKLSELIFQKSVRVENKGLDRYRRILGIVYFEENCINEEMISSGYAWHFKKYDSNNHWAELENNARSLKIGLWSDSIQAPPWEWRK